LKAEKYLKRIGRDFILGIYVYNPRRTRTFNLTIKRLLVACLYRHIQWYCVQYVGGNTSIE
jgi:hypothetical protein